jgi:hypothetical protein
MDREKILANLLNVETMCRVIAERLVANSVPVYGHHVASHS